MDILRSTYRPRFLFFFAAMIAVIGAFGFAADNGAGKADPRYPFRTDFANPNLPWYMPKPGEFPPHHSDRRIGGELVSADFIHRSGDFRTKDGQLIHFTMPPYGSVNYLNSDADLRDVPLGTFFLFFLNQDANGNFTRLATMQDQFTMDNNHGFSYRLDAIKLAEGKLLTTKHKVDKSKQEGGPKELFVTPSTRVWKLDKQIKLTDLAVGDELLFNFTGKTATNPGHCTDIWVGPGTHKLASETQRAKFAAFLKFRGLPGWIEKVEGDKLTVTLFTGDPATYKTLWLGELKVGMDVRVCVANDELRTWNPGTDNERSNLLEVKTGGIDAYGTSGVKLTFTVAHMLEGFRKGRIVRIFAAGWKMHDQFYAESLMCYGYSGVRDAELVENVAKEYPTQFPYRTDYGNENLPWFQLKDGEVPPRFSDHVVIGELEKVNADQRGGQFRTDCTGELVDFTLAPQGASLSINTNVPGDSGPSRFQDVPASVRYLNADATLAEIPLGTRCHFHLYQNEKGAFTRATLVTDDFSYLSQRVIAYRLDKADLDEGKLEVASQLPQVKNYNGDMEQPPDVARAILLVTPQTRVWKGSQQVKLSDIAVGDLLLVNMTGEEPGAPSHCTDIWVGPDTHQLAANEQTVKHHPAKKKR